MTPTPSSAISSSAAVIFDLDGVLIDSEGIWNRARIAVARENGGRWPPDAQRTMMGMSSLEWSRYMHEELGVALDPERIADTVVGRLEQLYREDVPVLPGAREAVAELAGCWPLGLASSANRPVIALVLELTDMAGDFAVTVSSEEVQHGKPAPDVYLEAARRLGIAAGACAAVEDSSNGLRSAAAAGMKVIAVPNREFPPEPDALDLADVVLRSVGDLGVETVEALLVHHVISRGLRRGNTPRRRRV